MGLEVFRLVGQGIGCRVHLDPVNPETYTVLGLCTKEAEGIALKKAGQVGSN